MSVRTIQFRPSRNPRWQKQGGWEAFEAGGCPVCCGPNAREQALSYACQRAGYGRAEIQVLDESGDLAETISNEDATAGLRQHKGNGICKKHAPVGIRTSNLLIRSQMLYPVELRAPGKR